MLDGEGLQEGHEKERFGYKKFRKSLLEAACLGNRSLECNCQDAGVGVSSRKNKSINDQYV